MKNTIYFFLILLEIIYIQNIPRGKVYKCHENSYRDEQCLTHEKLGDVDFYWIRKCKGSKVCVKLPYYGTMAGVCSIKVRSHYDGESCRNNNKCTSGICDGNKCKGFIEQHICQPGLGQCKKGLVCRKENSNDKMHKCLLPIPIESNISCDGLVDENLGDNDYIENLKYYLPENNICQLGSVCSNGKCVRIHSIPKNGNTTNPLACVSGTSENNQCNEYSVSNSTCFLINDEFKCGENNNTKCLKTSKGGFWCPTYAITNAFDEWYSEWSSYLNENDDDINFEAYRYTANKKSVNEYFFRYIYYGLITDADECAYDFFWKNNSSFKFGISILIFLALFLIF